MTERLGVLTGIVLRRLEGVSKNWRFSSKTGLGFSKEDGFDFGGLVYFDHS
jgi:hypothetical protein